MDALAGSALTAQQLELVRQKLAGVCVPFPFQFQPVWQPVPLYPDLPVTWQSVMSQTLDPALASLLAPKAAF